MISSISSGNKSSISRPSSMTEADSPFDGISISTLPLWILPLVGFSTSSPALFLVLTSMSVFLTCQSVSSNIVSPVWGLAFAALLSTKSFPATVPPSNSME